MPKTSTPNINSDVAIGRRINGSEMFIGEGSYVMLRAADGRSARGALLRVRHPHPRPLGQPVLPVDDDLLADIEPFGDDREAVLHRSDLDRAPFDRVVGLDDIGVIAVRADLD